ALLAGFLMLAAAPAHAQVQMVQLAAPDAFSTRGRDTGLPAGLWRGTPVDTARIVLPMLSAKPLSPARPAPGGGGVGPGGAGRRGAGAAGIGHGRAGSGGLGRRRGVGRIAGQRADRARRPGGGGAGPGP